MTASASALARRLGPTDAVVIGLGSMIGAGVFAAFAPAAAVAGSGLLLGLAIAAVVAFCNATSSAQLAAQYPVSGGTYVYAGERLGAWPGFLAGWSFVIGKTASCAAMALTVAGYVAPPGWGKPVAILAVLVLTAVDLAGITRTAALARVLVAAVLVVLVVVVATGLAAGHPGAAGVAPWRWAGVLPSAGLLFFAFAGYARIATLGEEVREPARTIPRAIVLALGIVLVVYAAVAAACLAVLGPRLGASAAPLADVVLAAGFAALVPVVAIGAAAGSLGSLLALLAGVGRTSLAMARNGDLPRPLAAVSARTAVPWRATVVLAAVVCGLVLVSDLRGAIGFSSFGVLLYYLLANASALTQDRSHRRYPRAVAVLGAVGCAVLVVTLPTVSVLVGIVVLVVGVAGRMVRLRLDARRR
ncbi:MAG TPA: APC family permease [Amnibacterium sp.]|uniref:APC family permease n=1 Tax=Amnibacterium sp. TaxID=1872496 RepID=UPI002F940E88